MYIVHIIINNTEVQDKNAASRRLSNQTWDEFCSFDFANQKI